MDESNEFELFVSSNIPEMKQNDYTLEAITDCIVKYGVVECIDAVSRHAAKNIIDKADRFAFMYNTYKRTYGLLGQFPTDKAIMKLFIQAVRNMTTLPPIKHEVAVELTPEQLALQQVNNDTERDKFKYMLIQSAKSLVEHDKTITSLIRCSRCIFFINDYTSPIRQDYQQSILDKYNRIDLFNELVEQETELMKYYV